MDDKMQEIIQTINGVLKKHTEVLDKVMALQTSDRYLLDRLLQLLVDKNILSTEEIIEFARKAKSLPSDKFIEELEARLRRL